MRPYTYQPSTGSAEEIAEIDRMDIVNDEGYQIKATPKNGDTKRRESSSITASDTQSNGNDVLEILGADMKRFIQGAQELRHLGIEEFVLPLPKIVVVGDQSTGKSSLIEGMSEIKVPRSNGCCTRCPVEINITENINRNERWKCNVLLCRKYMYEGPRGQGKQAAATRQKPLGPWLSQDASDSFFATVTSKDAIQDVIYWAQLAILNPSTDYEIYKPDMIPRPSETMQVKFSPNLVRLDISGPDLPNLSFYDLPGLFGHAEVEDEQYLKTLVKNLMQEYIRAENCIIVLALPMNQDLAVSTAAGIVKEKGAGNRTVGVLTKPDRVLPSEALWQWNSIATGGKFKLGLGYHVVKNNADPTVDHDTARREETEFFQTTEPYATQLAHSQDRFGTFNLQKALSYQLTSQIRKSLPEYNNQILKKLDLVRIELSKLPKPLEANLPLMLHGKIMVFDRELREHIDGGAEDFPFRSDWYQQAMAFRKDMMDSHPILKLEPVKQIDQVIHNDYGYETPDTPTPMKASSSSIFINIDDSEDNIPCDSTPSRKRARKPSPKTTPRKKPVSKEEVEIIRGPAKRFSLLQIRAITEVAYVGLPNITHPKVYDRMCKSSISHWNDLTSHFLDQTEQLFTRIILQRVDNVFGIWKPTKLYKALFDACGAFIQAAMTEQRTASTRSFNLELYEPMTFNEDALKQSSNKAKDFLEERRRRHRAIAFLHGKGNGTAATKQAWEEKLSKLTASQLGEDPFHQEIVIMSTVRGYYEHACSRYVDVVAQSIQGELFPKCRNNLPRLLLEELGLDQPDANERCAILLEMDPRIKEKRTQLKKEEATLLKGLERLQTLAQESSGDEGECLPSF